MTLAKAETIYAGINDAFNSITFNFKDRSTFERKMELLNLMTAFEMYLKEATYKISVLEIELKSISFQLGMLADIRNAGLFTENDKNLEAEILKRKEDIQLAIVDIKTTTTLDIPEELMIQITSWYK